MNEYIKVEEVSQQEAASDAATSSLPVFVCDTACGVSHLPSASATVVPAPAVSTVVPAPAVSTVVPAPAVATFLPVVA